MKQTILTKFIATILTLSALIAPVFAANKIESVRIWPSPDSTRVVFDLSDKPEYSYFFLSNPDRLVIDLRHTNRSIKLTSVKAKGDLLKRLRYSSPEYKNSTRVVLDLNKSLQAGIFALPPVGQYGNRLVVDLKDAQASISAKPPESISANPLRDLIIAVDAGHGGEDPGSIGPSGLYEKVVTFQIAQKVKDYIDNTPGMRAVLTREGDYYVHVNKRSEIARQKKADLLISIHADAFTSPQPRGGSVWILSMRRANTEIGRWIEQTEQQAELLGGAGRIIQDKKSEKYLAHALLEMSMDHSISSSYLLSEKMVEAMSKVTRMHKSTPQAASLGVLKSPDIPSLLVETGFMSNPSEERLLSQHEHQTKLAKAITKAIDSYFTDYPIAGTWHASQQKSQQHVVKRGESLSRIAKRYSTSVAALKSNNQLTSDLLKVGQVLKIP
ncbi:N-acetylmuramoyl-L-alanine amidase [Gayadomonas joobiniege]|uniref:N-acetylmuramoyl-L-alanine amidase n=1 Tax=Gayadomonas joobiniege TaxID=1234606 RepID=UPI000380AD4B|nr:N-acetylmuramoyl-L-alanine amidase [Gayadomonas joobiniege]